MPLLQLSIQLYASSLTMGDLTPPLDYDKPEVRQSDHPEYLVENNEAGNGSFGFVMKAVQKVDGKVIALKRLRDVFRKEQYTLWALRECAVLRQLRHKNVVGFIKVKLSCVKTREAGEALLLQSKSAILSTLVSNGDLYLAFECMGPIKGLGGVNLKGCSLDDLLDARASGDATLNMAEAQSIFHQILTGLEFINKKNVVHRDLKGANILLKTLPDGSYLVQIADLGMCSVSEPIEAVTEAFPSYTAPPQSQAQAHGGAHFGLSKMLTGVGSSTAVITTLHYRAPEVVLRNFYSASVDVFACGCILADLMCARHRPSQRQTLVVIDKQSGDFEVNQDFKTAHIEAIIEATGPPDGEIDFLVERAASCAFAARTAPTVSARLEAEKQKAKGLEDLEIVLTAQTRVKEGRRFICLESRYDDEANTSHALDLIQKMTRFSPNERSAFHSNCRVSVTDALKHPFFEGVIREDEEGEVVMPVDSVLFREIEENVPASIVKESMLYL